MKARKREARAAGPEPVQSTTPWFLSFPAAAAGLILLSLLAYSNSFSAGFALDWGPILKDPRVQSLTAEHLGQIFSHSYWWPTGEAGLYRPVTTLSFLFNYSILGNGETPAGYHVVNWLLHAINVVLALALSRRMGFSLRASVTLSGLWALHPVLTEAVTNVAGRSDLLGAASVLAGLLAYMRAAESQGAKRGVFLGLLAAIAAAGAGAKESAVILPALIVAYEFVCRRPARIPIMLTACAATVIPIAGMLYLRWSVLSAALPAEFPFTDNPIVGASLLQGRLTALAVMGRYLGLVLWPLHLSSDYSFPQIPLVTGTPSELLAWAGVAALAVAVVLLWRASRSVFFFAALAFLTFLPASNLVVATGTIMAERLIYLPTLGLLAMLVWLLERASTRFGTVVLVLPALLAVSYGARTWQRNLDWHDDFTMAQATVVTSPNSFKIHRLLAADLLLLEPTRANLERAVAESEKSVTLLSAAPDTDSTVLPWGIAASARLALGDLEMCATRGGKVDNCTPNPAQARREYARAEALAVRATQLEPVARAAYERRHNVKVPVALDMASIYRDLAAARLRLNKPEESLAAALESKRIDPSQPDAYEESANAYLALHQIDAAALTLLEGMFVTSSNGLREELLAVYGNGGDPQHCAVVDGPRGPALNPSCETVRRHFCAVATKLNRQDVITQMNCGR